jgi:hypothetical protein
VRITPMPVPTPIPYLSMCTPAHTLALKDQTTLPSCGL